MLLRHSPGRLRSHCCGTSSMAVSGARVSSGASAGSGTMKVQLTNSVCSSQRRRKVPRSTRRCVQSASGPVQWWSCSKAARCARLASRCAGSASITTWAMAAGPSMASAGRAWTSLCSSARRGCCWGCERTGISGEKRSAHIVRRTMTAPLHTIAVAPYRHHGHMKKPRRGGAQSLCGSRLRKFPTHRPQRGAAGMQQALSPQSVHLGRRQHRRRLGWRAGGHRLAQHRFRT